MPRKAAEEDISMPCKRIKRSSVDFISELPDDLILKVLSYLPGNEAVRSSSLSHRWHHLSSLLPVRSHLRLGTPIGPKDLIHPLQAFLFGLSPSSLLDPDYIQRSLTSETTLLSACEIIPDEKTDAGQVASWSEALFRRGVRDLMIDFRRYSGPDASSIVVRCKSLDKLELRSCSLLQGNPVGCISLTRLRLVEVRLSEEMLLGLVSGCKSLTSLELIGCHGFKELRLEDAARLKSLRFQSPAESMRGKLERIEIEGGNLEVLELRMTALKGGIDIVAPRLRSVLICLSRVRRSYFPRMAPGLWKIINGAKHLFCLQLRGSTVDCLSIDHIPESFNTAFLNLKRLYMNLVLNSSPQAVCLAILLQNFSMLEQLNLVIIKGEVLGAGATLSKIVFEEHAWRLGYSMCISHRLQNVTISGFMGQHYEMNFAGFILCRAHALKRMNISLNKMCTDEGKMNVESLSHLTMASPKAKLVIKKAR